ncbi:MAG TPA: TlpA disulfide reductase family protein [Planctomycetota bacterium]|nr:TlpA disulfide reductase family protein [Planctomycetota bacterium]
MRRLAWFALVPLVVLGVSAAVTAQDDGDDDKSNPMNLSDEEKAALDNFTKLERFALDALSSRDLDGAKRRYKKLIAKLDADELLHEPLRKHKQRDAHYNLACAHSLDKEPKEALAELERSIELEFWGWKHMKKDSDLDNIRDEDEFHRIIARGKKLEQKAIAEDEARLIAQVTSSLAGKPVYRGYDFTITTSAEDEMSLESLRGKVVVVDFFEPWDEEGASLETEALVKLHHAYKKKGVVVLGLAGVAGNTDISEWLTKWVDANEVKYPVAKVDTNDEAYKPVWASYGTTKLLFIDKRGKVRGTASRLKSYDTLEAVVQQLLASPDPKKKD